MTTPVADPPTDVAPSSQLTSLPELALRRRLLALLQASVPPEPVTYEEFLAWADEDTLAEWVDGKVIMTSPASLPHQRLAGFLLQVLSIAVEVRQWGVVIGAPFQMKLERSGREPDLLFVAAGHEDRLREGYLEGPADLVVEIVSPESVGRDRGEKFTEYEAGGVPEYWLLDPQRRWAEFYLLEGGRYRLVWAGAEGQYRSRVLPGFWLRVEWLWQQPLPPVLAVLRELGLV
jgi:Uma2 family endonuclease